MYDFEVRVKVRSLYEVIYTTIENGYDQRDGYTPQKQTHVEKCADWDDVRTLCFALVNKYKNNPSAYKIEQIVEIRDMTDVMDREIKGYGAKD